MIDTSKYEGHAEGNWDWVDGFLVDVFGTPIAEITEGWNTKEATPQLIADAPLLLEAYKELRKRNEWLEEVVAQAQEHYHIDLSDEGWPRWREE
mgnify:FL=1